jgi:hypothetical protein
MAMRALKIIQPVSIVFVVHIIFTIFLLRYYQGDISCLVHAGPTYTNSAEAPKELCLKDQGDGYDGQFNYRFALNPFSNQPVLYGISVDRPAYRYQRILYPFLAWVLTSGNKNLVPVVFVLINLIFVCALTALSAKYALDHDRNTYWSLALGLYLGFLISYALDLGHSLEIFLLFAATFLLKRKDGWAVFLLACAVLTRETALLFAAAICVTAFFQRWPRWHLYLLPLFGFVLWQGFLLWFWQGVPNLASGASFGFPLVGFLTAFSAGWAGGDYFGLFMLVVMVAFGLAVTYALRFSTTPLYIKIAWAFYSVMTIMMSFEVWAKFNGYLRGLSEWYFFGCLILFPVIKLPNWRWSLRRVQVTDKSKPAISDMG